MSTTLEIKERKLCLVWSHCESGRTGGLTKRHWYPIREATEADKSLCGRPLTCVDPDIGLYVDEEGDPYRLKDGGGTFPIHIESGAQDETDLVNKPTEEENAMDNGKAEHETGKNVAPRSHRRSDAAVRPASAARRETGNSKAAPEEPAETPRANASPAPLSSLPAEESAALAFGGAEQMTLRHKLCEVRRRIGYVQKRGFNERSNYSYVTAADLAGAVGDLLAELGVVIVPSLESIAYEAARPGGAEVARAAQVVMSYAFTDVNTGEVITAKVAGQGLDSGDKAPYKAMTGALKYALLQSFLLATGDDPEDERGVNLAASGNGLDQPISAERVNELRSLISETETELDRVLAYYKINSLEEMTEGNYRRAVELLHRKRARLQGNGQHAQN